MDFRERSLLIGTGGGEESRGGKNLSARTLRGAKFECKHFEGGAKFECRTLRKPPSSISFSKNFAADAAGLYLNYSLLIRYQTQCK